MPSSSNVHRTKPSITTITAPSLSSVSPEAFPLSGPGEQPQTFSLKASFPLSGVKRSKGKSFLVENLWLTRLPGADTLTDTAAGNSSCPEGCHGPPEPPAAPRAAPCGQCSIVPPRGTPGTFFWAHWQCSGFSWWLILLHFDILPDKAVLLASSYPHLELINAIYYFFLLNLF